MFKRQSKKTIVAPRTGHIKVIFDWILSMPLPVPTLFAICIVAKLHELYFKQSLRQHNQSRSLHGFANNPVHWFFTYLKFFPFNLCLSFWYHIAISFAREVVQWSLIGLYLQLLSWYKNIRESTAGERSHSRLVYVKRPVIESELRKESVLFLHLCFRTLPCSTSWL